MTPKPQYPPDWPEKSTAYKEKHNYTCEDCGQHPPDYPKTHISVHHLDHDPFNNEDYNLLCTCAKCHFIYEKKWRSILRIGRILQHLAEEGQEFLPGLSPY